MHFLTDPTRCLLTTGISMDVILWRQGSIWKFTPGGVPRTKLRSPQTLALSREPSIIKLVSQEPEVGQNKTLHASPTVRNTAFLVSAFLGFFVSLVAYDMCHHSD